MLSLIPVAWIILAAFFIEEARVAHNHYSLYYRRQHIRNTYLVGAALCCAFAVLCLVAPWMNR